MSSGHMTIYPARRIITMEKDLPRATAVGVLDGVIAGVGTMTDLKPWMDTHEYTVDETLADKVLVPGLIDPHVHPLLPAILTQMPFIAPEDWRLPQAEYPRTLTPADYVRRLQEFVAQHDFGSGPFFTWGYHALFHGDLYRQQLDDLFPGKPIFLWQRSFHEIITNTPGLEMLGEIDLSAIPESARTQVDLERGYFFEGGLSVVFPKIQPLFFAGIMNGFARFAEMVHQGGVTTVADLGTGIMASVKMEAALMKQTLGGAPFRTMLTPIATSYLTESRSPEDALDEVRQLMSDYTGQVFIGKHFKLMADGAFYGQRFQLCAPGYTDGHHGEWVMDPAATDEFAKTFWDAGFQLHIHSNGDEGARYSLDLLKRLLNEKPRFDHRFTLEHWGYATEEQNREVAALGAIVSGQPWYVYVLADKYAEAGLGPDRAHQMSRFRSLVDKGVPLALHSDCTMGPLEPLRLAWSAATRETLAGNVVDPAERLTLDQALRAITIDAAWILGLENDIGSVRTGKKADFTVLNEDPYETGVDALATMRPWGTVFEGRIAPIA